MTERRFDIVFSGKLINGAEILEVKEKLRKLFKLDTEAVEKLFSGNPMVIKTNVDRATATKYQQAIAQAGASIQLRLHQSQPPDSGQPAASPADDSGLSLLPAGSDILAENERQAFNTVEVDTSHLHLDEIAPLHPSGQDRATFGEQLPQESRYPGTITDTSIQTAFTLLDANAHAATQGAVNRQDSDVNTDHLSMAATEGYLLKENERPKVKKTEVDTSALTLADK